MQKGKIGVTSDNLFPIIKKFLYSDHDIFLREIVANAVDAIQKLKTLAAKGDTSILVDQAKVRVALDESKRTITVSDDGIGMTAEEIEKYINQIAFSGANEFLEKYQKDANAIIGHFGLGFYSAFMVSHKVEIITKSYIDGAKALKWSCNGSPEYIIENAERDEVGTDIIMYINEDSEEFLQKARISEILNRYCKFLPVPVVFGKKTEWKDGKEIDTDEDNQINDTTPAWTKKPLDLKDDDYASFYSKLYPFAVDPLFHIHLNVDYPFNLTGILYFPRLKNTIEVQKNKIQLYCNQVFVTDSVEGIVPEFLTLLHGVIDSPDIPLNVSRSYLQSDSNVKKISAHITRKVSDRLTQLFKDNREEFEKKWDDLKIFIEYGILTEEKFAEKAMEFFLLKNTDGKYFTFAEYEKLIEGSQKDKDNKLIFLYTNDENEQFTFIQDAKGKGYDVLVMNDVLSTHLLNKLEQKNGDWRFVRVDSDVADNLIKKDDGATQFTYEERQALSPLFQAVCPDSKDVTYIVDFKDMGESAQPMVITRNEFMRRMKDMSKMQGGGMSFYGDMPESLNLVVNTGHPLVQRVLNDKDEVLGTDLDKIQKDIEECRIKKAGFEKAQKEKKEEEVAQADKEKLEDIENEISSLEDKRKDKLASFGRENKLVSQMIDLALLSNGMLKGESLDRFVRRSVELIK